MQRADRLGWTGCYHITTSVRRNLAKPRSKWNSWNQECAGDSNSDRLRQAGVRGSRLTARVPDLLRTLPKRIQSFPTRKPGLTRKGKTRQDEIGVESRYPGGVHPPPQCPQGHEFKPSRPVALPFRLGSGSHFMKRQVRRAVVHGSYLSPPSDPIDVSTSSKTGCSIRTAPSLSRSAASCKLQDEACGAHTERRERGAVSENIICMSVVVFHHSSPLSFKTIPSRPGDFARRPHQRRSAPASSDPSSDQRRVTSDSHLVSPP